jgi:hypothetical protein
MKLFVFCLSLSLFVCTQNVIAQSVPSMAEFDITLATEQTLPLGNRISFDVVTSKPTEVQQSLQNWPGIQTEQVDSGTLRVEMFERPTYSGEVSAKYLEDTFVIDISEKSTLAFAKGFLNEEPSLNLLQLEAYVSNYIDNPSYVNGFNIASVVASERSGDCTEYAVLLAALSRSIALPARVIIGTVILEEREKLSAFGHAWVEVWHNQKWNILDAALHQSQATQHFYLPASDLSKESPGYYMALAKATNLLPSKIRNLKTAQ